MIYDAADMARTWLAVAHASGKDDYYPALSRTVHLEQHPEGLRLAATDSYLFLTGFVPGAEHGEQDEPGLDEAPIDTATAMDLDGRATVIMKYALKRALAAAKANDVEPEISVRLNVRVAHPDHPPQLEGMAGRSVVIEMPDVERIVLPVFDGQYPSYRGLFDAHTPVQTDRLLLHPDRVARIASMADLLGGQVGWTFGGDRAPARVDVVRDLDPPKVRGLVQPLRWDWYRNEPRVDNPEAPVDDAEGGDG